ILAVTCRPIIFRWNRYVQSGLQRLFSTSSKNFREAENEGSGIDPSALPPITKVPLNEEVPWIPKPVYANPSEICNTTRVSILENGLKVASEPKFGNFCTVGVVIDSGSRYEVAYPSGISHFLEKLSFGRTRNMTREDIMGTFEKLGGICDCQSSRDTFIYAASVETVGMDSAMEILAEVTLRPQLLNEEITDAKMAVTYDLEDLQLRPEKDTLLTEMIHAAAFRDNTLGLPKICPPENVLKIDRSTLFTYLKHHHTPSRMVVAGVGVNHDTLVEAAQKYFVERPAIWEEDSSLSINRRVEVDHSYAQYTGGFIKEEADLSDVSLGPNPLPELAHLVIGLESVGHQHDDFVTCCVLNMMMGGGGSFSAGGPGKGMYTRLYTNVLNRYACSASAVHTSFSRFGINSILYHLHAAEDASVLLGPIQAQAQEQLRYSAESVFKTLLLLLLLLLLLHDSKNTFANSHRKILSKRLDNISHLELTVGRFTGDVLRVIRGHLRANSAVAYGRNFQAITKISLTEMKIVHEMLQLKIHANRKRFTVYK
ncbi:unnamed protein product, partial [Meganyctiphanes norvegica]